MTNSGKTIRWQCRQQQAKWASVGIHMHMDQACCSALCGTAPIPTLHRSAQGAGHPSASTEMKFLPVSWRDPHPTLLAHKGTLGTSVPTPGLFHKCPLFLTVFSASLTVLSSGDTIASPLPPMPRAAKPAHSIARVRPSSDVHPERQHGSGPALTCTLKGSSGGPRVGIPVTHAGDWHGVLGSWFGLAQPWMFSTYVK